MTLRFIRTCLGGLAAVALFPLGAARAQNSDTTTLGPMVISATKTPAPRSSLTQPVTVLSGEELRARGVVRVSDALRSVPGVSMVQNGAIGSVNTLFLRGGESRYTRVMIDGVAVNAPGGFFDFSHLTTDNIDRIEIVRGPASVVYGADAASGIVRIFTRQGRGPLAVSADARAGTYGTRHAGVQTSAGSGRARFSIGAGSQRTDGVLPFNNQYYNGTLSGSAGITPSAGSDVALTARYTNAEFHYPTDFTGAPVDSNAYRVQHRLTVGLDATAALAERVKGRLLVGTNEVSDLTEDIAVPFGSTIPLHSALMSRNKRRTAEAGLVVDFPKEGTLTVGAEYLREREASVNAEGPVGGRTTPTSTFDADRDNKAVYGELIGTGASGASYTLSARRDDNSDYDAFTTYRVGASLPLGGTSRLRASLSTAFNAPAFNQLRPTLYTTGSPDLSPEKTRSWEIGVEQSFPDGTRLSAGIFNQRFRNLIQYVPGGPPNFLGGYANLTEAESNGFETELSVIPAANWSATASYTRARPHVTRISADYAGDLEVGQALIRRPVHSGSASLAWSKKGAATLSVNASYAGDRPDIDFAQFPSPVVTLPAYVRLDVASSRDIFRSASGKAAFAITARVENALDKRYEDVLNFRAPGRTILLGVRFSGGL